MSAEERATTPPIPPQRYRWKDPTLPHRQPSSITSGKEPGRLGAHPWSSFKLIGPVQKAVGATKTPSRLGLRQAFRLCGAPERFVATAAVALAPAAQNAKSRQTHRFLPPGLVVRTHRGNRMFRHPPPM